MDGKWNGSCFEGVLTLGLLINLFTLFGVWQVYFRSPVVTVERSFGGNMDAGIDRVVLIVSDGLQAAVFFDNIASHPHLTSVVREGRGVWGTSESRMPTLSRPGVRAMIGGLWEDPSAVFTLWNHYLTPFDSLVSRSAATFVFGYDPVVELSTRDAPPGKVKNVTRHYKNKNVTTMDADLLAGIEEVIEAKELQVTDKLFILIFTVSIDIAGHEFHPHTENYYKILAKMDHFVATVEKLISEYYGDDRALYVLSADHGQTDEGQHGGDSMAEKVTPLVVWGKGIKSWGLNRSIHVNQTDVAPLLASALNVPMPSNSRGRLEASLWANQSFGFMALLANLDQVNELGSVRKRLALGSLASHSLLVHHDEGRVEGLRAEANNLFSEDRLEDAMILLHDGITICLARLDHYERIEQNSLLFLLSITILLSVLLFAHMVETDGRITLSYGLLHLQELIFSILILKGLLGWPLIRLPLLLLPLYLTRILLTSVGSALKILALLRNALLVICGVSVLALAHSTDRTALCLGLVLCGVWTVVERRRLGSEGRLWLLSLVILGLFPFLQPIDATREPITSILGPLVCIVASLVSDHSEGGGWRSWSVPERRVLCVQLSLLLNASVLNQFPCLVTRVVAWSSLLLIPVPVRLRPALRLGSLFIGLSTPFAFLSFRHESIFLAAIYVSLRLWLRIEADTEQEQVSLRTAFRRAWLHVFFGSLGYFGISDASTAKLFFRVPTCFQSFWYNSPQLVRQLMFPLKGGMPVLFTTFFFPTFLRSKRDAHRHFLIILILTQALALHAVLSVQNAGHAIEIAASVAPVIIAVFIPAGLWILAILVNSILPSETQALIESHPHLRSNR